MAQQRQEPRRMSELTRLQQRYGRDRLDTTQLAECLGYRSARTVTQAIFRRTFPVRTFKVGSRVVADVEDVAAYLERQRTGA